MVYRLLADLVVLIHALFIVFVILGAILALRWPRIIPVHLLAVFWGALVEFMGWTCPLTPLENWARTQAGETGYSGGFLERYLNAIIYPEELTRRGQIGLGVLVLLVNVIVYWLVLRRRRMAVKIQTGH